MLKKYIITFKDGSKVIASFRECDNSYIDEEGFALKDENIIWVDDF